MRSNHLLELIIGEFMSTTRLKTLAVITMLIDHLGEFIPNTPIWFRWIGRISGKYNYCLSIIVTSKVIIQYPNLNKTMD